jgi:protease-4
LASENIYHELMNLKRKKPIVVSMGNYAASGGYYMACAGDSVFAETNTITGSIGVVGVMFNITNMMKNKLGVTTDQVKTGPFADFPNMTRPMTDGERQWIQNYLDSTYVLFKSRVAEARKLPMDTVENLAQGHVYSGTVAKKLKLVDDIGDIQRALRSAAKLAKMDEYALVDYPEKIDPIEEFISSFSGKKREEAAVRRLLGDEYIIYQQIQKIRSRQNQIQTIMPFVIEIR